MATENNSNSWERITQQIDKEVGETEMRLRLLDKETENTKLQLTELKALREIATKTQVEKPPTRSKIPSTTLPPKRTRRQKAGRGLTRSHVLRVLKNSSGRLTSKEIYVVMNQNGFFSPAKSPVGAVNAQLSRLVKNNTVERETLQGRGIVFSLKHNL